MLLDTPGKLKAARRAIKVARLAAARHSLFQASAFVL
jgi:hypothetical protein